MLSKIFLILAVLSLCNAITYHIPDGYATGYNFPTYRYSFVHNYSRFVLRFESWLRDNNYNLMTLTDNWHREFSVGISSPDLKYAKDSIQLYYKHQFGTVQIQNHSWVSRPAFSYMFWDEEMELIIDDAHEAIYIGEKTDIEVIIELRFNKTSFIFRLNGKSKPIAKFSTIRNKFHTDISYHNSCSVFGFKLNQRALFFPYVSMRIDVKPYFQFDIGNPDFELLKENDSLIVELNDIYQPRSVVERTEKGFKIVDMFSPADMRKDDAYDRLRVCSYRAPPSWGFFFAKITFFTKNGPDFAETITVLRTANGALIEAFQHIQDVTTPLAPYSGSIEIKTLEDFVINSLFYIDIYLPDVYKDIGTIDVRVVSNIGGEESHPKLPVFSSGRFLIPIFDLNINAKTGIKIYLSGFNLHGTPGTYLGKLQYISRRRRPITEEIGFSIKTE